MPKENLRAVDITQPAAREELLPCAPMLSSRDKSWENICVEYCRQPAFATPELCHQQYMVTIHTGTPIRLRQVVDGQVQVAWVREGDIFLAPPGFSRQWHWDRETEYIALYLEPDVIARAAREVFGVKHVEILPLFKEHDWLIRGIGLALKTELELELELNRAGSRLYADSLATTLTVHLLWRYSTPPLTQQNGNGEASRRKLQRVLAYINDHLAEELSLKTMANEIGMNQYHFARLFKQFTGVTPHQYVNQCRIERAKQLLLRDDLRIRDVVVMVGCTDPSHFTKLFHQITGMTPKAYRER